jgi:subtilisin-like proprotein convertase family protein
MDLRHPEEACWHRRQAVSKDAQCKYSETETLPSVRPARPRGNWRMHSQ